MRIPKTPRAQPVIGLHTSPDLTNITVQVIRQVVAYATNSWLFLVKAVSTSDIPMVLSEYSTKTIIQQCKPNVITNNSLRPGPTDAEELLSFVLIQLRVCKRRRFLSKLSKTRFLITTLFTIIHLITRQKHATIRRQKHALHRSMFEVTPLSGAMIIVAKRGRRSVVIVYY